MLGKDILERLYLVGHIFILFVASRKTVSYCLSGRLSFAPKSYIYCSVNTTNDRCALQSNTSVMFEDFSIEPKLAFSIICICSGRGKYAYSDVTRQMKDVAIIEKP